MSYTPMRERVRRAMRELERRDPQLALRAVEELERGMAALVEKSR